MENNSLVRWAAPLLHEPEQVESMLDSDLEGPPPERLHLMNFAEIITNCIQVCPQPHTPKR